jgi:Uncharacterised nucleotidyltransferase
VNDERRRTVWSLRLSTELIRLLDLLARHGIPALPFKGPVLADALYGDIAARESCDLDILLRRQDLAQATRVLLDEGYRTDLPANESQRSAYLRARYELHFTTPDRVPIEIHQAFLPDSYCLPFDYDALWQRLEPQTFCGREVLALGPEDLLLMLCAHGAKHAWTERSGIRDVARLLVVAQDRISWPMVIERARAMGGVRILLLGLFLAAELMQAPAPADLLAMARRDRRVRKLGLAEHRRGPLPFFLAARERFRDKLMCCARLALTPTEQDYSLMRLPRMLSGLYYPLHALRVAARFV